MKKLSILLFALIVICGCGKNDKNKVTENKKDTVTTQQLNKEEDKLSWSYEGKGGQDTWPDMFGSQCGGKEQSPVDIKDVKKDPSLKALKFDYHPTSINMKNNGHTVYVYYDEGSSITINGESYSIEQFHFHTPAEHKIEGKSFPMEIHVVHKSSKGKSAALGLMVKEGAENKLLTQLWSSLPEKNREYKNDASFNLSEILPKDISYYTYQGSLTTPPCTERLTWVILKTPIEASSSQIEKFHKLIGDNSRLLQSLNGRIIASN